MDQMFKELCGRVGAVFLEGFHITPAGVFVNRGILIKLLSFCLVDQATGGDEFHVNLDALPGVFHLLIRLGNIFGVGKFFRHDSLFFKETVEPGNGTFISALHEFYPEDNQPGMRISSAHIPDEFDFLGSMLVWVGMRASGTVSERIPGAVITVFPAVDILTVGFILYSGFRNPIAVCVVNK